MKAEKEKDKEYAEEAAKQELLEAKVSKDLLDSARWVKKTFLDSWDFR